MNQVVAILLAAGRSRRMGAFKPLLPFGHQTVVEACIENLLAAGVKEVVVVVGHRAEEMKARLARLPVSFAVNDEATSEMSVSIARGVERVRAEAGALLIALCDQPAIPPLVIRRVIEAWEQAGAVLVVPEFEGRGGHPVLIDARFRRELLALDADRGLRALFDAHREAVRRLPVASPFVARDMDTWEDYARLYMEIVGTPPPG